MQVLSKASGIRTFELAGEEPIVEAIRSDRSVGAGQASQRTGLSWPHFSVPLNNQSSYTFSTVPLGSSAIDLAGDDRISVYVMKGDTL